MQDQIPVNPPAASNPPEGRDRGARPPLPKKPRPVPAVKPGAGKIPIDLEGEVKRINGLLGKRAGIRFVLRRSKDEIRIEVVDRDSSRVLGTFPPSELDGVPAKLKQGGILVDSRS